MNPITMMQAAGRVIRTEDDRGVVALLDERFLGRDYLRLFPREWDNAQFTDIASISSKVERFWNEWL